ncbi:fatty acid desaturase family protein [Pantanalinema sp. GBBB05]|uniref:fatty acid desaturase family protein n=1 Tax=Pantanalinema sp. GBBB05 TaxID=2604139 RepID=UPI001DF2880C|nr:fatty acid desaturase [Pantanalinema sp. GBBB05]
MLDRQTIDLNSLLRRKQLFWDSFAMLYTLGSYAGSIGLLLAENCWLNAIGVVWLTHSLVLSAYLAHEFMHGIPFADMKWNALGGNIMLWLNGSCYIRFQELMQMHIAHHVNRIDYCRFDIPGFLRSVPKGLRLLLLGLEWLYFPSLAFLLRIRLLFASFLIPDRRHDLSRTILILLIRGSLFAVLAILSVKAILLYCVAYISMIHILRFVDAFQHTYDSLPVGEPIPEHHENVSPESARCYEQANTFSNVISVRFPWLNLLLLNFGYHNAHHEVIKCPWYHLPALNRALYADQSHHYITLLELVGNYHRFRVSRILTGQGQVVNQDNNRQLSTFYGAIEVSFLVVPIRHN